VDKLRFQIFTTDNTSSYPSTWLAVGDYYAVDNVDFVITEKREKDKFYYIKSVKNKLKLANNQKANTFDFNYFYLQIDECYKYYVKVYKFCGAIETLIYNAYFTQNEIEYDLDKCVCEIELKDNSIYNCFNDNKSIEVNAMDYYFPPNQPLAANFKFHIGAIDTYRTMDFVLIISKVLGEMACGAYEVISDFFDWQYDGFGNLIIPTAQAMTNYVNPAQPNYWVWIAAKSDFIDPNASNPATSMPFSFDMVEKIMTEVFNVYWVIDGNRVRFEHYSWFTKNLNYDTTTATNFPLNEYKNKIKRNKDDYPSKEVWDFMETGTSEDFGGLPIIYDENCSGINPKDRGLNFATTDILYIRNSPSAISMSGIVILDVQDSGGQMISYIVNGYLTGVPRYNGRLGIANLHNDLHKHNRPYKNGDMNGVATNFLSPVYNKLQDDILVKMCCTDDYEKYDSLVRTEIGDGAIDEAEINFTKEQIKFKLRHE
jgi:hypothetical protein